MEARLRPRRGSIVLRIERGEEDEREGLSVSGQQSAADGGGGGGEEERPGGGGGGRRDRLGRRTEEEGEEKRKEGGKVWGGEVVFSQSIKRRRLPPPPTSWEEGEEEEERRRNPLPSSRRSRLLRLRWKSDGDPCTKTAVKKEGDRDNKWPKEGEAKYGKVPRGLRRKQKTGEEGGEEETHHCLVDPLLGRRFVGVPRTKKALAGRKKY